MDIVLNVNERMEEEWDWKEARILLEFSRG